MGCWNETCYISKLPIYSGEEIVLILLRKYKYADKTPHTCYVCDSYVPFGLPIFGKYDDYGNIEDITNAEDVIEYLKNMEIVDKDGIKVNTARLDKETLSEFTSDVLCGHYFLKDDGMNIPLFGMMVKKELYDILLSNYKLRKCYGEEITYEEHITSEIKKEIEKIEDLVKDIERKDIREKWIEKDLERISFIRISMLDESYDISPYLIKKYYKESSKKAFDYLIDIIFFKLCLQALRMGYYCVSGLGSQSDEMQIHKEVANFILKQCAARVKYYREENEDNSITSEEILSEYIF